MHIELTAFWEVRAINKTKNYLKQRRLYDALSYVMGYLSDLKTQKRQYNVSLYKSSER